MPGKYIFSTGNRLKHILIVENVLGHSLPPAAEIHHVDGNGRNNIHSNLVVCPSHAYHFLLHRRERALRECGNADWMKCVICKKWDHPTRLVPKRTKTETQHYHQKCSALYALLRTKKSYSDLNIEKHKPGYISKH